MYDKQLKILVQNFDLFIKNMITLTNSTTQLTFVCFIQQVLVVIGSNRITYANWTNYCRGYEEHQSVIHEQVQITCYLIFWLLD